MLGDKQKQDIGENAVALQAGRDLHVGMSFSEVRELVHLFLRDNFPKLRDEARTVAEEQVKEMLRIFELRLSVLADKLDPARFREPDVQAAINDAVIASARRGSDANPEILCALIAERVSATPSKFKDMVVSEAVQVVPRLTATQIKLLVLVLVVRHFEPSKNEHTLTLYEGLAQLATPLLDDAMDELSPVQISHIRYTGALEISGGAFAFDIFEHLNALNPHLGFEKSNHFKEKIMRASPAFFKLIERHDERRLGMFSLTSVGRAIALAHLSTVFPGLNYNEWLH